MRENDEKVNEQEGISVEYQPPACRSSKFEHVREGQGVEGRGGTLYDDGMGSIAESPSVVRGPMPSWIMACPLH